MDLPQETEDFIRESIESSLGLQISATNMQLKLQATEDARHRLQDQIFLLQERLSDALRRVEKYKAEASMNAIGIKKCIEEKEIIALKYDQKNTHCINLEREIKLYERDIEKFMESLEESNKEIEDLRAKLHKTEVELTLKNDTLQKEKEIAVINLNKAEDEVKVLIEDIKILNEENKMLRAHFERSAKKKSASNSAMGKRKSRSIIEGSPSSTKRVIDFGATEDLSRQPLSPLHVNSPDSKMTKK